MGHLKLKLEYPLLIELGIKQTMNGLHKAANDRAARAQHAIRLLPHGPYRFRKTVGAGVENKVEGLVVKTGQVRHVALHSRERKPLSLSD